MMIVPWLLFWCLNLVKNRRVSLLLIPIMAILVDAHSAIGLVSLFTLAITMITFVAIAGIQGLWAIAPRLIISVVGATVHLLAQLQSAQYYDPASWVTHFDEIVNNFRPLGSYFYDGTFRWLAHNSHDYVQIDFAIWMPIAIAIIGAATLWFMTGTRPDRSLWGRNIHMPCALMLLACFALFLVLQAFYWICQLLSPLKSTDYPSRMLAFMTPTGVIL
jgi:hypothetical protein